MKNTINLSLLIVIALFIFACTNPRRLQDAQDENLRLQQENEAMTKKVNEVDSAMQEMSDQLATFKKQIEGLRLDTTIGGQTYRSLLVRNAQLNALYEKVNEQLTNILANSSSENQRLMLELEEKKRELETKQKELEQLESELKQKETNINELIGSLKEREKRINNLEAVIKKQDSLVNALKIKITDALMSFKADELTVELKNGKIYVSLSEQLLFKSGSINVDSKGKKALNSLSEVLENNQDINILIEGHTDNKPFKQGGTLKDNWDLSVLRATSIVRILTEDNNVDPKRVIASGRSEFHPVDTNDTNAGRSNNRRIEIILSPDLDALFKILEGD